MQRAIAAYVDGIGARSVTDLLRIYPAMPSNTRRGWETLFTQVKRVEAEATNVQLEPAISDSGTATLSLAVRFANPASKRPCTQTTQLRVHLARSGATWHIVLLDQRGSAYSPGCD